MSAPLTSRALYPLRAALVLFALASLTWAIRILPESLREGPIIAASERLVAGDVYPEDAIRELLSRYAESGGGNPEKLAAVSIARQWLLERAMATSGAGPAMRSEAKSAVAAALAVAPSDSYQWLSMYWASRADGSFDRRSLTFIEMSYVLAPRDAWIALRRSPLVLAIYPVLTPALQKAARTEFSGLVRSHLYTQAAKIAASVSPNTRKAIAAAINDLGLSDRESFYKAAVTQGIIDMAVSGTDMGPIRPWRQ